MILQWFYEPKLVPRVALIAVLTVAIAGAMQVNIALLGRLADSYFVHWIYFAAGVRLIAIMLFGWPAIIAAIVAYFVVMFPENPSGLDWNAVLLIGSAKVLGIWAALWTFGKFTIASHPWDSLSWTHIPFLTLWTSGLSALCSFSVRGLLTGSGAETLLRDTIVSMIGDLLGTAILIAIVIRFRRSYLKMGR